MRRSPTSITITPSIESITDSKFFYPTGVYHPFSSIKEQNEWMARSSAETIKKYIASIAITPQIKGIRDPYGGVIIAGGGYINTNIYLGEYPKIFSI